MWSTVLRNNTQRRFCMVAIIDRKKILSRVRVLVAEVWDWCEEDCGDEESIPLFSGDNYELRSILQDEFQIRSIRNREWNLVRNVGDIADLIVVKLRSKALLGT